MRRLYTWTPPDGQYKIRLIIFFAAKDGEALYSQQKQDRKLTVAQIMNCLLPNSIHSFSHVRLFATPWTAAHQASLSITSSQSLLKLMFIKSVMTSIHLILCHLPFLLPSICPRIRVFSSESFCICQPKYWSFSFSISPSNENLGPASFRIDWFDLLAVQETLKSLL